ncbi:MAG: PQQ-binding-like beta-propeller repeat protein [Pirellulales bacterium]|nr:PQQ-binding-like beta-propeller repeat protein [Pirellulales bacterium]
MTYWNRPRFVLVMLLLVGTRISAVEPTNWPRWRGTQDNGSIEAGSYPTRWNADEVLWKAPLPGRGCSTPILWNKKIVLTAAVDGRDGVLAFDWSGRPLWQTVFGPEDPGKHRNGSGSNASPVTDGQAIYVYFKSGTLAALEFDGSVRWQTNLVKRFGPAKLFWDHGTSPILSASSVIMARMHNGESWVAAFDKKSGEIRWKVARNYETPVEGDHGYATPMLIKHDGKDAVLVWGAEHVTVYDPEDGKLLWSYGGFNPESNKLWPSISTPVIAGDIAVIAYGRNDRGIPRLHGIRLGTQPSPDAPRRLWKRNDVGTFVPSPIAYRGRVYLVGDRGRVECVDPATGKMLWTGSFPKNRAAFYASPLIAGGKLYAPREDGVVFVARIEERFELLAENDMQDRVIASPVPALDRLFIRGERHLFCIAGN